VPPPRQPSRAATARPRVPPQRTPNLFAGGGVARVGDDFTDRAAERREIARALRTPGGHLLVVGPRRIGKTSLLRAVVDDLRRAKAGPVLFLDLWSASTVEDVTTRLAGEAAAVLGRRWTDVVKHLASRLHFALEVKALPNGLLVPLPAVSFRESPAHAQRQRLVTALDTLEAQAKAHRVHLGIVFDEFQEIERVGRDDADAPGVSVVRQLRAAIQHHRHVTYVFAGSDRVLIDKLSAARDGPLHNLARRYEIGPLPAEHFAAWIDARMARMGLAAPASGAAIIALAGPRTRDVRTLAESVAELARSSGRVTEHELEGGVRAVIRQRRPQYELAWKDLVALQQNCLRAVASGERRLTSLATRTRYSLGDSSRVAKAVATLVERSVLLRADRGYAFDDPFFRAWVIDAALPDLGVVRASLLDLMRP